MSDELLPYYNRELAFIRRLGAEFAEAHPKIAGRLRLGPVAAQDPHVERLIEAFAYLNARTRHKLEDDFPEISDAVLGVLYPHYQAPIPAMAVVRFVLDRGQGELKSGYVIPSDTALETDAIEGEPCRFRTCYPTTLWPVEVGAATLAGRPLTAPTTPFSPRAQAVLRLELRCLSKDMTFPQMSLESLRFFLKGQTQHVYTLYELLHNNVLGIAAADSAKDTRPILLEPACIRQVGFRRDEGMLPYRAGSFLGYRLLTEYFACPEKFLFVDLEGLTREVLCKGADKLELYIYFNAANVDLEQNVSADTFQLGCAPIVNLYSRRAEPIALRHTTTEYHVVPDARRPRAHEVYSIDRVTATSPDNEQVEYQPFYSFKHASDRMKQKAFWYATRRPAERAGGQPDRGTEVYLSLVDFGFNPNIPADWTLAVETTCLNRDIPHRLPLSETGMQLRLSKGGPLERIECLTGRPTETFRPALKHGALWRLVSHLSLNHLSLVDYEEGADALREILSLYNVSDSTETRSMIEGIASVRSRRMVGRIPDDSRGGFCRGVEVTIRFDEDKFAGSGVFLFASVLERFLGLYCSINSFSKLIATTNQREGVLRRWAPRAGEAVLL
jgi:type VI secretion system protein ImpG